MRLVRVDPTTLETHHNKGGYKVRSLILFWAIDKGNNQMLNYLWNHETNSMTNWGAKNLEFMLMLANDL